MSVKGSLLLAIQTLFSQLAINSSLEWEEASSAIISWVMATLIKLDKYGDDMEEDNQPNLLPASSDMRRLFDTNCIPWCGCGQRRV